MLLHALRRWFARHPKQWMLGVALGLTLSLGGAQLAAACHEAAHVVAQSRSGDTGEQHGRATHDCPLCLLAAAIGGAATAPATVALHVPHVALARPAAAALDFTPRVVRAYASRAPPARAVSAA